MISFRDMSCFSGSRIPLLAILVLFLPALGLRAQTSPEIEKLAGDVAERLAGTTARHILIAPESTCLLDERSCSAFEELFRLKVSISIPDMIYISRNDLLGQLKEDGFISIDGYREKVLEVESPKTGAELLITESLHSIQGNWELEVAVIHPAEGQKLADFKARATVASLSPEAGPMLLKDPDATASMIIFSNDNRHFPVFRSPTCQKCPQPPYPPRAVEKKIEGTVTLLVTISETGVAEHIIVVEGPDPSLNLQALSTVKDWQFKPAIGLDGTAFAARLLIEVTYRLKK